MNVAKNLQDLIGNLKIINVSSLIDSDVNNDRVFHSINDCYRFMKENVIIIVVDEELVNDFHKSFVELQIQSIHLFFKIIDEDFKINVFNKMFRFDNNINIVSEEKKNSIKFLKKLIKALKFLSLMNYFLRRKLHFVIASYARALNLKFNE